MTKNMEFLNYIHQNVEMGIETIAEIRKISKDIKFNQELDHQLNEYQNIYNTAELLMQRIGGETKDISLMSKISTYISINKQTLSDNSPSHIAGMLIKGSTMGIVDITKNIKRYDDSAIELQDLARKLLEFENNNVESLKKFL